MYLKKRKFIEANASNCSTCIISGQSSNVLNRDNVRFPWAYPKYK
ncbi:hypothetical protein WAK64_13895 [Bacillus spongiae]|uniref:Uncharacterized protein n=1 Tax=Bacillus spongiae TaxID=2683610 RepID=A0ABU8HFT1_9BACI